MDCGGTCVAGAECCAPADCGSGDWECTASHTCECWGMLCYGTCYADRECCNATDCPDPGMRCLGGICEYL